LNLLEEIEERNTGFDNSVPILAVNFNDLVHPMKVENNTPFDNSARSAVPQIFPSGKGPQGDSVNVGKLDDVLYLFNRSRTNCAAGLVVISSRKGVTIAILAKAAFEGSMLVVSGDMFLAKDDGDLIEEIFQRLSVGSG
jgi:hypothetical protein